MNYLKRTGLLVYLLALFSLACQQNIPANAGQPPEQISTPEAVPVKSTPVEKTPQPYQPDSQIVQAVARSQAAVVSITTEQRVRNPFAGDVFSRFLGQSREAESYKKGSLGSGVIIDSRGIVLTNEHVVLGASRIIVTTESGLEMEAEVIGTDPHSDLAVLKVESRDNLPALSMEASRDLVLGEDVLAIGNPFGLGITVTRGIVSALGRPVRAGDRVYNDFVQTDAAINPGNSGGALLDLSGRLIGINTAIRRNAEGIGFAIPISRARTVVEELLTFGKVRQVWLGIQVLEPSPWLLKELDLVGQKGLVVDRVYPELMDQESLFLEGDLILQVNQTKTNSTAAYNTALAEVRPGGETILDVIRPRVGPVKITVNASPFPETLAETKVTTMLGLKVASGQDGLIIQTVTRNSAAAKLGLRPGDVIVRCNNARALEPEDLGKALLQTLSQRSVYLSVVRGRRIYRLTLPY